MSLCKISRFLYSRLPSGTVHTIESQNNAGGAGAPPADEVQIDQVWEWRGTERRWRRGEQARRQVNPDHERLHVTSCLACACACSSVSQVTCLKSRVLQRILHPALLQVHQTFSMQGPFSIVPTKGQDIERPIHCSYFRTTYCFWSYKGLFFMSLSHF